MPNWKKVIVSGSDAILNEITASGGILTSQNIMPDVDNTLSLGSSTQRFQLNGGTPVTVTGSGTQNTVARFNGATEVENSTITNTDTLTTITHNNDGNDVFIVSGSNGELIKVTDSVTDTLFRVNDGSGIAKLEVSSSGLTTTNDVSIDDWGSVSASLAFIESTASSQNLQQVTDNGATTTNNITIDGGSDARLILDRNANSNDAEIVFRTNGTENWSIGTGQVGGDNSFTLRYGNSANYFVLDNNGDLSVSNSGSFGHLSVDNNLFLGDYAENQSNRLTISNGSSATAVRAAVATYCGVIVDYTIYSTDAERSNQRTGTYRATFNGNEVQDSETMTNDIGDTNGFVLSTSLDGTNFTLTANNDIGQQCRVSYTTKLIRV